MTLNNHGVLNEHCCNNGASVGTSVVEAAKPADQQNVTEIMTTKQGRPLADGSTAVIK